MCTFTLQFSRISVDLDHPKKTSGSLDPLAAKMCTSRRGSKDPQIRWRGCPLYDAWPAHSLLFPRVAPLLLSCVPGDLVTKGAWLNGKHHCISLLKHKENHLEMDIISKCGGFSLARLALSEGMRCHRLQMGQYLSRLDHVVTERWKYAMVTEWIRYLPSLS